MQTEKRLFCTVALAVLAALASNAFAADPPYAGKWKMNDAKSDLTATTVTYKTLASGEWQSTVEGHSFKFKMDGKGYPDGLGNTCAWKATSADTWEVTWKLNDKVLSTDTLKVTPDGTLTINAKGTRPNGEAIDDTGIYQRVSGGPGLAGKWKTKSVKSKSPEVIELVASGADGLSFKEPAEGLTCEGKIDGSDYPCSGPTLPPGWTIAMTRGSARSLNMNIKKDGNPFFQVTYTVAADGNTLIETGGATDTGEKIKIVYERQ